jgi:Ca-activated chloride channel family protein
MAANREVFLLLAVGLLVCASRGPVAQTRPDVRIVTNVELVQIPVIVFDDKGAVATNLNKSDFRVLEDGIEQQLLYCERVRESVSFVILADLSSSMTRKIPFVEEAALSVIDPVQPVDLYRDEYSLFGIESRVKRLVSFTRDQQDLERRLPLLLTPTNGSTALFDGIYAGVTAAQREAMNNRRAVIIISDGGDNHSRYNLRETKRFLEEADVPVFAVMAGSSFELPSIFSPPENKTKQGPGMGNKSKSPFSRLPIPVEEKEYIGPAERRGPNNLKALTEVTGGGVFTAHHLRDLPRIVRTIGLAVRYRYVLSYKPTRRGQASVVPVGESNWHKIHLELLPKDKFAGYGIPYYKPGYSRIDRTP